MKYRIAEKFVSINGEGTKAGQLATFIRLCGCNLKCSYCDTMWANAAEVSYTEMTAEDIVSYIKETGVKNVTLTGGEPLLNKQGKDIADLLKAITSQPNIFLEIETNGSIDLSPFANISDRISFTMDYKLPDSDMEEKMCTDNFTVLSKKDTVKFVAGSIKDLTRAKEIIEKYALTEKCHVYISPVFDRLLPVNIVEFMMENKMNNVNLQLQLHKIIWEPDKKGV